MITDLPTLLRYFDRFHQRTVRDILALPPEADGWRPPRGEGEKAWNINEIVHHIAESRLYCPASTIFAGWRQSVLPVHLLGVAPLLGCVGAVAGDVKLQDDGVVHDPVNRRGGGHGVGEDALPLREDQV